MPFDETRFAVPSAIGASHAPRRHPSQLCEAVAAIEAAAEFSVSPNFVSSAA